MENKKMLDLSHLVKKKKICKIKINPTKCVIKSMNVGEFRDEEGIAKMILNMKKVEIPDTVHWIWDAMKYEFSRWAEGDFVFIDAKTGTGKSTFIEKVLDTGTKRCLILTNRRANLLQIEDKIQRFKFYGNYIMSYQQLEMNVAYNIDFLNQFDMLILDEAHYFLSDSNFNSMVNVSLRKIMSAKIPVKIFMSATINNIKVEIVRQLLVFENNDTKVIKKVHYYSMKKGKLKVSQINAFSNSEEIINEILYSKEKWLIFVKSSKDGISIANTLNTKKISAVFIDKKSIEHGTKNQKNTFNYIIKNEHFKEQVIIATSVLDNGVNLYDRELKNIVVYDFNPIEIIQMIGRKRCFDENDTVKLYIFNESKRSLNKRQEMLKNKLIVFNYAQGCTHKKYVPPIHYINSAEGDEYRRVTYYDPILKKYFFNYLGKKELTYQFSILKELKNAQSPFDKKIEWLKKALDMEKIEVIDTEKQRKDNFLLAIKDFANKEFEYKTRKDKRYFHELVSTIYWSVYEKETGERSDRPLNVSKLNMKFQKHQIPIKIFETIDKKVRIKIE